MADAVVGLDDKISASVLPLHFFKDEEKCIRISNAMRSEGVITSK